MRISDWSSDVCSSDLERDDLAIDAGFADAAGDELGDLAAEIDDQDRFRESGGRVGSRHGWPIRAWGDAVQRSIWPARRTGMAPPHCWDNCDISERRTNYCVSRR